VHTTEEKKFKIIDELKTKLFEDKEKLNIKDIITVDGVRVIFENGWGLVRASNTTPVIVTRFEAKSQNDLETIQNTLMNYLNKLL